MKHYLYAIIIIAILFQSCNDSHKIKQIREDFANTSVDTTVFSGDSLMAELPSYNEIIRPIVEANIPYDSNHLLNLEAIVSETSKQTALHFGMCATNLAYARYFHRVQDCRNIIVYMQQLSDVLAIPSDMLNSGIAQAEAGINKPELVFQMADSIFNEALVYFNQNELFGLSAIMFSGAYIESVRLLQALNIPHHDIDSSQVCIYKSITKLLAAFSGDVFIDKLEVDINNLQSAYTSGSLTSDFFGDNGELID